MTETRDVRSEEATSEPINWLAMGAVYAAVGLGMGWLLYWGDYRNVAWLALMAAGGGLTLYGRLLEGRGEADRASTWKVGGAACYLVVVVWAGWVLWAG